MLCCLFGQEKRHALKTKRNLGLGWVNKQFIWFCCAVCGGKPFMSILAAVPCPFGRGFNPGTGTWLTLVFSRHWHLALLAQI